MRFDTHTLTNRWLVLAIQCLMATLFVSAIASASSDIGAATRVGVATSPIKSISIDSLLAAKGGSKTSAEMADDLAGKLGLNRVSGRTAGGKQIDIELRGKGHFDKATGQRIETPHIHEARINVGPNGKINLGDKITRPATKQDIRAARRLGGG